MRQHPLRGGRPPLALALVLLGGCAAMPAPERPSVDGADSGEVPTVGVVRAAAAARIGAAETGERVTLPAGTVAGQPAVLVGERYAAASGRDCRRLRALDGRPLARVVCAHPDGWRFVRSLASPSETRVPRLGRAELDPAFSAGHAPAADPLVPALPDAPTVLAVPAVPDAPAVPAVPAVPTAPGGAAETSLRIEPLPTTSSPAAAASPASAGPHDAREHVLRDGETLWSFSRRVTGDGRHWPEIAALNGLEDAERLDAGRRRLLVPATLASE